MQTINDKIARCLHLQGSFNSKVNTDWKVAGYAWNRAMWIEAGELADHIGYKWWKNVNQPMDRNQALLEVVDIFHFLLSDLMIRRNLTGSEHTQNIVSAYKYARQHTKTTTKNDILLEIERFVEDCVTNQLALNSYFRIVVALDFTLEDVVDYYLGKNVLNLFRYDNGYLDGTYKKTWGTQEDNVVLESILDTGERDFIIIYNKLSEIYKSFN